MRCPYCNREHIDAVRTYTLLMQRAFDLEDSIDKLFMRAATAPVEEMEPLRTEIERLAAAAIVIYACASRITEEPHKERSHEEVSAKYVADVLTIVKLQMLRTINPEVQIPEHSSVELLVGFPANA